jgi:cell division protein FtsI/penicillin-binding protein 2
VLALFFLQKDLGPALILYLLFLGLFIATSRRYVLGTVGLAILLGTFAASYRWGALATVKTRLEMWLSPWANRHANGIQLAESLWAMSAGGWRGLWSHASIRHIPAGHTDLILAAAGEMFGLPGILVLLALLGLLFWILLRAAFRAPHGFEAYFAYGLALLFGIQALFMAGATLGLVPLTGLPVPFLSYGKSAMIAAFALAGLVRNVSSHAAPGVAASKSALGRSAWVMPVIVTGAFVLCGLRSVQVMLVSADALLARGALTPQRDGVRRFVYNRRLTEFAAQIRRGDILDRTGFPLATSDPDRARSAAESLDLADAAPATPESGRVRYYLLGARAVHILGNTGAYWTDPRTVEKAADAALRGYRNPARGTKVDGQPAVMYDFSELVPIYRDWQQGGSRFAALLARDRSFHTTLDARMQLAAAQALEAGLQAGDRGATNAAAVVLDAGTGRILASVSLPSYDPNHIAEPDASGSHNDAAKIDLDRARFEIYPPGSSFKIVTAAAALETYPEPPVVECNHRNIITWMDGATERKRSVVDDEQDDPHRKIDWASAIVRSCNVYYATVGTDVGADKLYEVATRQFHLDLANIRDADEMRHDLADNSYGQGRVTVTPQSMAVVAATIANGGFYVEPSFDAAAVPALRAAIPADVASKLRQAMIGVVQSGTGQGVAPAGLLVGGKTGTAQTKAGDEVSDSWFIGFAERQGEDGPETIAFAFFVEHGGYGARAAAPAAKAFLSAYAKMNGSPQQSAGVAKPAVPGKRRVKSKRH